MRLPDDELPAELRAQFKALYQPARGMEGRDEAVLRAARAAGTGGRPWPWRRAMAMGIAAAVAVTVGILWQMRSVPYARTGDIRDAYCLARQLKAHGGNGAALEAAWDINKDGVVDERDVRALAQRAVRIDGGSVVVGPPEGAGGLQAVAQGASP